MALLWPLRASRIRKAGAAFLLYILLLAFSAYGQVPERPVRLIAEIPALPYIQAGLDWYRQTHELELTAVPTSNLNPKVFSVAFTQNADVLLTRYSTFTDFMQLTMFAPLNRIGAGGFAPPDFAHSDLILYQGEVIGVCFGDYAMPFLERPCLGVFASSPQKELAVRFISVVKENEPLARTRLGEVQRIAENFFASLFYVEDYASAFEFLYSNPRLRQDEWTREEYIDVMTNQWIYRRVDAQNVFVDPTEVVFLTDWNSSRDGIVYPEVAELYAVAVLTQDPNYVWEGRYPVRYLLHWVPDGDTWKVLSAPYQLFE